MEILKVQSTEDKLNYLLQTKAAIKQAIIDQGGTITENTTFREFVEQIQELNVIEPEVIEEIKQALRELAEIEEEQNEQIQTIVAALNTKLEEADVAELRTQADSNTTRITTAEEEVTSLKDRATSLEERTTNIETNKANQSDLDSTNTRVQLAEAAIQANTGDINAVKTRVQTAEENISTNTTNITKNTSDISNINENIEEIQTTVESNTNAIVANKEEFDQAVIDLNEEISKRLTTEAAKPLIKKVEYNATTATFTFEDMEGNTKTVDLPLEATVKGGRYDAARKVLVLILVSDDEIEIPVTDLVDVYTGLENAKIKVIVNNQNQIEAQLKSASVEKTDLATALVEELEAKAEKTYVDELDEFARESITTLSANLETITGDVIVDSGRIDVNEREINKLKTKMTTAEGNITTNTTNIANNTQAISDLETVVDGKLTMKELGDDLLEAAKATSAGTLVPKIFADLQFSHKYRLMLPYITINNTGAVSYGFQDLLSNSVNDKDTNPITLEFVKDENDDDVYIKLAIDQSKLTEVGKVDTVNNIQPDANKNITLDGSNINVDETAATKVTMKDKFINIDSLVASKAGYDDLDAVENRVTTAEENIESNTQAISNETIARQEADQNLQNQIDNIHIPEYSVVESTTTQGYAKTYSLTKDGVETGAKINIPKDLVVKSGEVKVVTVADQPYEGAVVGDKYIDLEINDSSADHIYIPVKDLVDVYTGLNGNKINVTVNENNQIGAEIKTGTLELSDFNSTSQSKIDRKIESIYFVTNGADPRIDYYYNNGNSHATLMLFKDTGDTKPTINGSNNLIYNTDAEEVNFDPSTSGLQSTKLAPAIRELKGSVDTNTSDISDLQDAIEEAGKVDTVNNIQPDSNKNITLDATQINVDETAATKVTIKSNLEDLATQIWNEHEAQDQINQYVHEDIDGLGERISTEETTRENADQELQNQIDSIHIPDVPEYTIEEQAQAETGYSKTYYLTKDGTQVGSKINIPKDLVIKSGEVKTVTVADQPYEGAQVGDKYIDITLNDVNEEHIYIPVKDLVDAYTGVDGSKINVTINNQNEIEALIKTGTIEKTDLTTTLQNEIDAKSGATNLVNGSATGSLRTIDSKAEDSSYTIGEDAFSEGYSTKASGKYSHAEGFATTASGQAAHAEGRNTKASSDYSHAEGMNTTASGGYSHAEGNNTIASTSFSHAEGIGTTASGNSSHAEGNSTIASGDYSHAEGQATKASGDNQHVQGKFNIEDTNNKYAHIVGNGTTRSSSNAHTLDWQGNTWYQGQAKVGGTSYDDANAKLLATQEYVDTAVAGASGNVNTVNNIQPDQNKNVQLDASNINLDDTAETPETLKAIIEAQATKITTLEAKIAELETTLGDIKTALELLNGVEDANNEEF